MAIKFDKAYNEEFEKKMQSTRQQIALLETKLRILRESEKKGETDNAEA
mgnify:CR=1 FL=1